LIGVDLMFFKHDQALESRKRKMFLNIDKNIEKSRSEWIKS